MWCKTCRSFSDKQASGGTKGVAKVAAETYVKGTSVVKKNNFRDHLTKSSTHATAVLRLSDDLAKSNASSSSQSKEKEPATSSASAIPKQATITPFVQRLTSRHKAQLINMFQ